MTSVIMRGNPLKNPSAGERVVYVCVEMHSSAAICDIRVYRKFGAVVGTNSENILVMFDGQDKVDTMGKYYGVVEGASIFDHYEILFPESRASEGEQLIYDCISSFPKTTEEEIGSLAEQLGMEVPFLPKNTVLADKVMMDLQKSLVNAEPQTPVLVEICRDDLLSHISGAFEVFAKKVRGALADAGYETIASRFFDESGFGAKDPKILEVARIAARYVRFNIVDNPIREKAVQ